eukprot:3108818-Rhodomonas_salina.1
MTEKEESYSLKAFSKFQQAQKKWLAWKQDVNTKTSEKGAYHLLTMFAVECAKQMISQWEKATLKQHEGFSTDLNNYPELVFTQAADNSDVIDSMVTESNAAVKDHDKLGSNWTKWNKCCYSTQAAYTKQVAKILLNFMNKINRVLVERILTAIFGSNLSKKGSREAEALRQHLITAEVKDLLSGSVNAKPWAEKPHKMITVQMWAKLVFKYKGVHDFNLTNILKELQAQYQCKANKTLDMSASIASLISWIKVCWKECFIEVKAKNPGSDQEGYKKALEFPFQKRSASAVLSEDMLNSAIKLASEDFNLKTEKE